MNRDTTLTAAVPAELVAASTERRTITGRVLPWQVVGRTSLGPARFARGAVTLPEPLHRLKLLAAHREPGQPEPAAVGWALEAADTGHALEVVFSVPEGAAGDEALHAAANHLRDGLSVEVSGIVGQRDAQGVLEVASSQLDAVAQVAVPAFAPAAVLTVTAADHPHPPTTDTTTTTAQEGSTMNDTQPAEGTAAPLETVEPTAALEAAQVPQMAAAATPGAGIPATPRSHGSDLTLARVSGMIASANRGELAAETLQAALSITTDVAGITPPAYIAELAGLVRVGRPTAAAIRQRPLPAVGMKVTYPHWKTLPSVDTQDTEGTAVSSTKAEIEMVEAPVKTEAGANELSMQAVDRTDPSAVEALLTALTELYARKVNASTVAVLNTAAGTAVDLTGKNAAKFLPALMIDLDPLGTPTGPLFLSVAWDVYADKFVGLTDAEKPAWWDGSVQVAGPTEASGNAGGVTLVVDPTLAPGAVLFGARQAATVWEDTAAPVRLATTNVGLLKVEVGVYGYHATTTEYPGGLSRGTGAGPAAPGARRK